MAVYNRVEAQTYFSAAEGGFRLLRPVTPDKHFYRGINRRGDRTVDFMVEAFSGSPLQRHRETIKGITVPIHQEVFDIPFDQAQREVEYSFRGRDRITKSVNLARTLPPESKNGEGVLVRASANLASAVVKLLWRGEYEMRKRGGQDDYIAYSTQELWSLPVEGQSPVKIMYVSGLAVMDDYRRLGVAAYFLTVGNSSLRPDIIMLRIRSGAVVAAVKKSKLGEGQPIFPLDQTYDQDPIMQAALKLADQNTMHPKPIDPVTGVTESVYEEGEDRAYVPDPSHSTASGADLRMKELGMNAAEGGATYIAVRVVGRNRWVSPYRS